MKKSQYGRTPAKKGADFLQKCYIGLIFLFLYAPIVILMVYSFNDSKSRGRWGGFTFKWYQQLLQDDYIMTAFYNTIAIAVLSALIATFIGTMAALCIHNMGKVQRSVFMNVTYLPVLNPDIVTGLSLMLLFIFIKLPLGFFSMLLAHVTFNVPYVILSVLPKLRQLNRHLYEAALDLGATPLQGFFKILLPELWPGIFTGALLAFTLSIDDFVVSFFTTGAGVNNLSIVVYNATKKGIDPSINALSTLMFIGIFLLLIIVNRRSKIKEKGV